MDIDAKQWHTHGPSAAIEALDVDPQRGLLPADVEQRFKAHGPNELRDTQRRDPFRMLLDQFGDFMILVLIGAALISGLIGDIKDTITIVVIVLLNAVIGFVQEYRAESSMAALKRMAAAHAVVFRRGRRREIPAADVVPGDVVMLEAGNQVPADLRLIEAAYLRIDESLLTGESITVAKQVDSVLAVDAPLAERDNMAFRGTLVTAGRGRGVAVATGMDTQLGRIAAQLEASPDTRTPLQLRLADFGRRLALVVLAICAVIFAAGLARGEPPILMFLTAISLAVAAIPEALPAVVTVALAFGARKLAAARALVRKLPAVETLGSVTYICSDKTGTLTANRMRVEELFVDGESRRDWSSQVTRTPWAEMFTAMALNNDAVMVRPGVGAGDPTEVALLEAADAGGYDKARLGSYAPRLAELPFDSKRRTMTTLHRASAGCVAYTKGAPEAVVDRCRGVLGPRGEILPLHRTNLLQQASGMAERGLRVLAVAQRRWPDVPRIDAATVERDLVFLGLVGMMDPPRLEAADAVALCRSAGITPVMITGDHPVTARNIAVRLGILDEAGRVVTGPELAGMDERHLDDLVGATRVYARVDPAQKIRIVRGLQRRGEFVAMTGDGVNDAPALKRADIGLAMGRGGTDVAREAASVILLDDNFSTIVGAVREGRRIFDNIRKFVRYVLTGNTGEIWTIFLAPLLGLPMPLLPIQILWINLVTDGLPGLALAAEPAEPDVMRRPPRPPSESIFAGGVWQHVLWVGLTLGSVALFAQAFAVGVGWKHWQTIVFTVLTLSQIGHVLAIRSERESSLRLGLASNLPLTASVLLTFALQMATIYVPWLNPIFRTSPLGPVQLGFCLALSGVVFLVVELEKYLVRRGVLYAGRTARPVDHGR